MDRQTGMLSEDNSHCWQRLLKVKIPVLNGKISIMLTDDLAEMGTSALVVKSLLDHNIDKCIN